MASLPCGGIVQRAGDLDDPDSNNVHIDVMLDVQHTNTFAPSRR